MAAAAGGLLLLGGMAGAVMGHQYHSSETLQAAVQRLPWSDAERARPGGWTHRAAVAHAVYAPEVRHPVEVNVAQGSATEQIARSMATAASGTQEVSQSVGNVARAASDADNAATELRKVSTVLADNSDNLRREIYGFLRSMRHAG
jgi:predicted HAD superfamily Cof-like phosphohydrolase